MREYVFEGLMARSGDEPFTLYGLIAESVELPEDRGSVTFNLNPKARFSDGTPIKPEDVLFSQALPVTTKVAKAEKIGERSVATFDAPGTARSSSRLLPSFRHKIDPETFERTTLVSQRSGPTSSPGRRRTPVAFRRNPDWWARDLACRPFQPRRSASVFPPTPPLFEAFKAGDRRAPDDPGAGSRVTISRRQGRRVIKREFETRCPQHVGPRLRTRPLPTSRAPRPPPLFDAEWINRSLSTAPTSARRAFGAPTSPRTAARLRELDLLLPSW
jgi:peptide/nickel transport system substrate-binding protein